MTADASPITSDDHVSDDAAAGASVVGSETSVSSLQRNSERSATPESVELGLSDNEEQPSSAAAAKPDTKGPLDIDLGQASNDDEHESEDDEPRVIMQSLSIDQDEDCLDDDLEHLLSDGKATKTSTAATTKKSSCCPTTERVGNMRIFLPSRYHKTGWGIAGPHWFGPPVIVGILIVASMHLVATSLANLGYGTTATCLILTITVFYNLVNTAYRDPGIVRSTVITEEEAIAQHYRWCDLCDDFQPPDGAHCPDCNICIAGFDHHCVWMGTCIGKSNVKSFVRFNLSWLGYLLYGIIWVTVVGPMVF